MKRSILALGLCLAIVPVAAAQPKPGDPIKLEVSPAKAAARPLRYAFEFPLVEQQAGNAADDYKEAARLYKEARGNEGNGFEQQLDDWQTGELKEFPVKEVAAFFQKNKAILPLLEKAGRREQCDWGHRDGLRKRGFMLTIEEIQQMRGLIRVVALHSRWLLAQGKIDESLRDIRLGLVMARHTAESPILISSLVALAMTTITLNRVDEIIQQPGAPNLYAALSVLPTPFVPLRKAIDGERLSVYGSFPGMAETVEDLNAGPLTEKQVQDCLKTLTQFDDSFNRFPGAKELLALNISLKHEKAKKALIEAGRPKDKVEAMPHVQVALLHSYLQMDQVFDDIQAFQRLPEWEAYTKVQALGKQFRSLPAVGGLLVAGDANGPAIPLAHLLMPIFDRVTRAQIRVDRRIAALQCVEALRLYAAAHDGKLPKSLTEIKEVTIPVDPLTGTAFEYELKGQTAVLKGNVPPVEKEGPYERVGYEVTVRK